MYNEVHGFDGSRPGREGLMYSGSWRGKQEDLNTGVDKEPKPTSVR